MNSSILVLTGVLALFWLIYKIHIRLQLSRAKHPSLGGHARISRRIARLLPYYEYPADRAFECDAAPEHIVKVRKTEFEALSHRLKEKAPRALQLSREMESSISDMQFVNANRVPFQFRSLVMDNLKIGMTVDASEGVKVKNIDGEWSYDLAGSYGVNLLGYDFYKECLEKALEDTKDLGPVLGPYHPVIKDNVERLKQVSGLDEVSFHMSGTEAVMQAVRLSRYHTGRSQLVMFCGAYHGWWDGVQPGIGNQRSPRDIYMLKDMSNDTLKVLGSRNDIACVLVNPLQALHPNSGASSDATLVASSRKACFDRDAYAKWLQELRRVCDEKSIVLILDEVFMGFRLGLGGAQEYFSVKADMVTYGKTLGGGLPVGVLCGESSLMKRYRENRPADVCFARGTFNSHPYVMSSMNYFLKHVMQPDIENELKQADTTWNERARRLNEAFTHEKIPLRVHNFSSVWLLAYETPSRFNWLLQYYLVAEGLMLSWVGSGRFIFSHNYTDDDFDEVMQRILVAAKKMKAAKWWWQNEKLTNSAIKKQVLREMLHSIVTGERQLTSHS